MRHPFSALDTSIASWKPRCLQQQRWWHSAHFPEHQWWHRDANMPGALQLVGFVGEEGPMHKGRGELLRRWGLLAGITPEAAFLCFAVMKHQVEHLCSSPLRQPSSWAKDWIRNRLGLHSFKLIPWIPPETLSEGPASLSLYVLLGSSSTL